MANAFYVLRQELAGMMGEMLAGIRPAASPITLKVDQLGVASLQGYGDDYFNDWFGRFYLGPHAETDFIVSDFAQLNGVIDLAQELSAVAAVTDYIEIYPEYTPAELGRAINQSISMVEGEALEDVVDDSIVVQSSMYEYEVPAGISHIEDIYMEGGTSGRYSIVEDHIPARYWNLKRLGAKAQIWFDGSHVTLSAARHLRLVAQRQPQQLTTDTQETNIDKLFVLYQAKALLHLSRIRGSSADSQDHNAQMGVAQALADRQRNKMRVAGRGHQVSY